MTSNFETVVKVVVELLNSFEKSIPWLTVFEIVRVVVELIEIAAVPYDRQSVALDYLGRQEVVSWAKSKWCFLSIHPLNNRLVPIGARWNIFIFAYVPFIHATLLNLLIKFPSNKRIFVIEFF
jgi:hypothetical protein